MITGLLLHASNAYAAGLTDVVNETLKAYFEPKGGSDARSVAVTKSAIKDKRFTSRRAGVFVTLSRNGKTRACWGSVSPQGEDLLHATAGATIAALTKDYRHKPITSNEWQTLKSQVTVIDDVEPLSSIHDLNPVRDGLLVRSGGKSAVLLPREAVDATYVLVQCRLKAGIGPKEPCQMYRLKAEIYQ